jgi:hypothetical protein
MLIAMNLFSIIALKNNNEKLFTGNKYERGEYKLHRNIMIKN